MNSESNKHEFIPRPAGLPDDLPWCGRVYDPDDLTDSFVYDGSMSMDDYYLMWQNIEAEQAYETERSNMSIMREDKKISTDDLSYEFSEIKRTADSAHFLVGQLFEQFFYEAVDTPEARDRVAYRFVIAQKLANILVDYTLQISESLEAFEPLIAGAVRTSACRNLLICEADEIYRCSPDPVFLVQAAYNVGVARGLGKNVDIDEVRSICGQVLSSMGDTVRIPSSQPNVDFSVAG